MSDSIQRCYCMNSTPATIHPRLTGVADRDWECRAARCVWRLPSFIRSLACAAIHHRLASLRMSCSLLLIQPLGH